MIDIVPLDQIAPERVETLLDAAFGSDRHSRTAYRLRAGTQAIPALSFAAVADTALLGTLQSWPVTLRTPAGVGAPLVLVGPVAVAPEWQRGGVGRALMTHMLGVADGDDTNALMMIGDPEYYSRFFGFTADATGGWRVPGPVERHRLLARIRRAGGMPVEGIIGPDVGLGGPAA